MIARPRLRANGTYSADRDPGSRVSLIVLAVPGAAIGSGVPARGLRSKSEPPPVPTCYSVSSTSMTMST